MTYTSQEWDAAMEESRSMLAELALKVGDGHKGKALAVSSLVFGAAGLVANGYYESVAKALSIGLEMGFDCQPEEEEDEGDSA